MSKVQERSCLLPGLDFIFGESEEPRFESAGKPKRLQSSLVHESEESCWSVPLENLSHAACGDIVHLVNAGSKAKEALAIRIADSSKIELSPITHGVGDPPSCMVKLPSERGPFEVFDSRGIRFGRFGCIAQDLYEVLVHDQRAYLVRARPAACQYWVNTCDEARKPGECVAYSKINSDSAFEIHCIPASDTLLIIAVVVSLILFTS
mmetsp:Transcript_117875/g.184194  ORF Transcript_117875/g.184194 Transcript_117875/m.184194 type:complete len:207 (-) Transcript_117875:62-682(-)